MNRFSLPIPGLLKRFTNSAYVAWRNRFLGSWNVNKFGLRPTRESTPMNRFRLPIPGLLKRFTNSAYVAWRNRFQGSLHIYKYEALAGRCDNPFPTRCLAPTDCSKILAQGSPDRLYFDSFETTKLKAKSKLSKFNIIAALQKFVDI